jgi:hypothetical protein
VVSGVVLIVALAFFMLIWGLNSLRDHLNKSMTAVLNSSLGLINLDEEKANALTYLEQKHGDQCEFLRYHGGNITYAGIRKIVVSCNTVPEKEILIDVAKAKDGLFSSDYIARFYETQTFDYIKQIADKYFNNFTLEIHVFEMSDLSIHDADFNVFIHNTVVSGSFDSNDLNTQTATTFFNELYNLGIHFSFGVTNTLTIDHEKCNNEVFNKRYENFNFNDEELADFSAPFSEIYSELFRANFLSTADGLDWSGTPRLCYCGTVLIDCANEN